MVRTKADAYTKASVKAPRKQSAFKGESANTPKSGKSDRYSGGNSYCPRPTPAWQKPITNFFSKGVEKDKCAENGSMQRASATCSSVNFYESVPGCSKHDLELMEFMDPESLEEEPKKEIVDSETLDENSNEEFVDSENLDEEPNEEFGDSETTKNEEENLKIQNKTQSNSSEEDSKNSFQFPGHAGNLYPVSVTSNEEDLIQCFRYVEPDPEEDISIDDPYVQQLENEVKLLDDDGVNAAAIGIHASPIVNDHDDQDSGVDE